MGPVLLPERCQVGNSASENGYLMALPINLVTAEPVPDGGPLYCLPATISELRTQYGTYNEKK